MFDDENGSYVTIEDYNKIKKLADDLFNLASDNLKGLSHDDLHAIVEEYDNHL